MDTRIHEYQHAYLANGDSERIGQFLASYDVHSDSPFRNYAVPDLDCAPTVAELEEFVAAFVRRNRQPRLEYLPSLSPRLEPALLAAGFVAERAIPVMVATPESLSSPDLPAEIDILLAREDDDLRAVAEAAHEAYEAGPVTEPDIDRLRETIANGGVVAFARDRRTGESAASGVCGAPAAGVSELAGIGTRQKYRRQGIAAALTAFLTAEAWKAGLSTVFLTPAGVAEERIYARAGYLRVGDMIHISLPQ